VSRRESRQAARVNLLEELTDDHGNIRRDELIGMTVVLALFDLVDVVEDLVDAIAAVDEDDEVER